MTAAIVAGVDRVVLEAPGVLVVERAKMPMVINEAKRSKSLYKIHRELKEWREWAGWSANGIAPMKPPVTVTIAHLRKNRAAMPDVGAPVFAVKGLIDGLVDAGILPDDGPEFVVEHLYLAPIVVGWQGLRVTLAEVPA